MMEVKGVGRTTTMQLIQDWKNKILGAKGETIEKFRKDSLVSLTNVGKQYISTSSPSTC